MDWWSVVGRIGGCKGGSRCCAFRDRDRLARRDGWRRVIGFVVDRTKPVVVRSPFPYACVCVAACVYACVRADQRHPRVWSYFVFEIDGKRYVWFNNPSLPLPYE